MNISAYTWSLSSQNAYKRIDAPQPDIKGSAAGECERIKQRQQCD
jgi:hypothetical protein